ncbi:MAG: P-II family nitrogen regulator [Chloroflexi bacterium]|nr:P-II family nitrogen regulator [Chloroflexota bacterium]
MKEIKAIIQEFMLPKVVDALREHPEFPGLTISRVRGLGRYETGEELSETSPKMKLEIVVPSALVDTVVELIRSAAHTGRPGDGKIFVSSVEAVVRISTGERDREAL